uniref:Uncharacterized protein n=1 Tax=Acrobeloides nanus TaxID=290746 RepID=A0A914D646_9BILA
MSKRWHMIAIILPIYVYVFGIIGAFIACNVERKNLRNESLKYDEEYDVFFQEYDLFTEMYKDCPAKYVL